MLLKKTLARSLPMAPFGLLRQMTSELDRVFDEPWTTLAPPQFDEKAMWAPKVDVVQKDDRLITRVDLPGVKKEDVSVEVTDGSLVLSGERKSETSEEKDNIYRAEREYGSFYRSVPLPKGVKFDDVKATFTNGVLEVSVPVPVEPVNKARKVEIKEAVPAAKSAA